MLHKLIVVMLKEKWGNISIEIVVVFFYKRYLRKFWNFENMLFILRISEWNMFPSHFLVLLVFQ